MRCKICNGDNINLVYEDVIRNGALGNYTKDAVPIFQCETCGVMWHEMITEDLGEYYESPEYRAVMGEGSEEEAFYRNHDKETLDKFLYTGTDIFRNKTVADIGCGAGAFLDFLKGVSKKIIAVEPSEKYRMIMRKKGFETYAYMEDVADKWKDNIDIITSFDVIEHVEEPCAFLTEIEHLLSGGGQAIIGTPTSAPIMRSLLGDIYGKKILFSVQHLWILSEKSFRLLAENAGFAGVKIKFYQRYGMDNFLGWIKNKEARSEIHTEYITETLDRVWKSECSAYGVADYMVAYLRK